MFSRDREFGLKPVSVGFMDAVPNTRHAPDRILRLKFE